MRVLIIMLCVSIGCIHATNTYAQKAVLDLKVNNQTIESVLKLIESQTDFVFFFNSQQVDVHKRVSITANKQDIFKVLHEIFEGSNVVYSVLDKSIILSNKQFAPKVTQAQKITGKVVDANGEPLIGVTVALQGSNKGTVSDVNGYFSLDGEEGKVNVLNVSYIGYKSQQVQVRDGKALTITMEEDAQALEEIVVVGYGTQKKINLTGAVAMIDDKQVIGRSADNLSKLLQGAVPNMNITIANGRPGQGGNINIRGINSISNDNAKPLILVDGVEGDIDTVNPNDVESISVLKDASSAAVYGARAAYGVILVTTKSGNDGKTRVSYNGRYSFGSPTVSREFETRGYYSAAINDMFFSTYQGSNYTTYNDEDYYEMWIRRNDKTEHPDRPWVMIKDGEYKYYGNFDWYNYFMDESRPTWEHNLSVSGGNDRVQYFLSGSYYDQKGVVRMNKDSFTKYNFRSKVSVKITPWLKLSNNTSFKKDSYPYPGPGGVNNVFNSANVHALASFVPINPDGTYMNRPTVIAGGYSNDMSTILEYGKHKNEDSNYFFNTTFEAIMTPIKNVTLTANYSYAQHEYSVMNRSVNYPYSRIPGEVLWKTDGMGIDRLYERSNHDWFHSYNVYGNYANTFADAHNVSVTAGVNFETKFFKDVTAQRNDLLSVDLSDFNLATGDEMNIVGGKNRYALFGLFYRLNYDYKNRYLFEFSGRYDGSSRFARGHRYGFFPSVSAGWRINEEKFFEPLRKHISNLKVRASIGSLGNQLVGYYDYLQTISSGGSIDYAFGDANKASGAKASAPNDPGFTWETVITKNIGLDLGLLNNRLNITADMYVRDTKDMLMSSKDLANVYGAASPKTNAANLRTQGWETSIGWNDSFKLKGKPFHYGVTLGLADNTSKVMKYNNDNKTLGTPYEGQQLGEIWGYVVDGFFKTDEEAMNYPVDQSYVNNILNISVKDQGLHAGDLKYVDLDGDNVISPTLSANDVKDQKVIGNSLPRYTYSVRLDADWNGIDFSALIQGVARQHWYPRETMMFWGPYARPYATFIPKDFMSNVWSEDNPDAYFPRPRGYVALDVNPRELSKPNTRYLQNVGYCRLRNVTIGYSLPRTWIKVLHMERVRVYFSGENLFTLSPIHTDYIDPEHAGAATSWSNAHVDVNTYPMSKTYSFGIDVTF